MLEVDQIFVVEEDPYVGERTPCLLDFFSGDGLLALLSLLAPLLDAVSPGPLDLNRADVIHSEAMVLEQTPGQAHFVGGLDQCSTEVLHAAILVLRHDIERRCQELLPQ